MQTPPIPYRLDLSTAPPDVFVDMGDTDWSRLTWKDVGRPYRVERWARDKREWEAERGAPLPVQEGWKKFNASFHKLFLTDTSEASRRARDEAIAAISRFDIHGAREAVAELVQMRVWNKVHMVEDAVWDPRGKRALFQGLGLHRPRILFLGAADGYEAMQLMAMYPGGQAVLVDYDDFCRTELGLEQAFGAPTLDRLNVDGGAISLGHPVGASGARIVLHLAHALNRLQLARGIATACVGGGQGGALLLERT